MAAAAALPNSFYVLDPAQDQTNLQEDYEWAVANVPFVDVPLPDVSTAYYYRWRSYRKHLTSTPEGWVVRASTTQSQPQQGTTSWRAAGSITSRTSTTT